MSDSLTKEKALNMTDCLGKVCNNFLEQIRKNPKVGDDWTAAQTSKFQQIINYIAIIDSDILILTEELKK